MQDNHGLYTTRDEVEDLLKKTREMLDAASGTRTAEKKKKLTPGKLIRRASYILIVVFLLGMLGKVWYDKLTGQVPDLFGYQVYVVETGSMIPTIPIGSMILVRELGRGDELKASDIITYSRESAVITHRITDLVLDEEGIVRYQTQGDNPDNSADPWLVSMEQVRGRVIWHFTWPWDRK